MTLDAFLVALAVVMMFGPLAVVLGWADRKTNRP